MKVIGIEKVSGTTKDGHPFSGFRFYGTYEFKKVEGLKTEVPIYISERIIADNDGVIPDLGDELSVSYNRFGKIADYKIIPQR